MLLYVLCACWLYNPVKEGVLLCVGVYVFPDGASTGVVTCVLLYKCFVYCYCALSDL